MDPEQPDQPGQPEVESPGEPEGQQPRAQILSLTILVEGGLGIMAVFLSWFLEVPPLPRFAWSGRDALLGVAASLPLLAVFLLMVWIPLPPLQRLRTFSDEVIRPLFAPCTASDLAGIAALAGFSEEVLFRGVLQEAFTGWFGLGPAVAAVSALFGFLHFITPTYALMAAAFGAYLSWVTVATDNLLPAILAHALYDFCALLYLVKRKRSE